MQCVRNVSYLNHLRHVGSVLSCAAHVNGKGAIQSSDTLMIQEVMRVAARSSRGGNFSSVGLREETLPEQKSRWLGNPAADVLRVPRSWPRATRPTATRSEERRVGKEGGSRGSRGQ